MRVLITTLPGDGHLHPLIPLAGALANAGHEVAIASAPSYRRVVESYRMPFFPVGIDWSIAESFAERWPEIVDLSEEEYLEFVIVRIFAGDVAEHALPDLLDIARRWSPDIIVRETCEFAGWLAAQVLGLPHASVEVTLFAFLAEYAKPVAASLAEILARFGQPPVDIPGALFDQLHLSFVPPSFEDPRVPLPATSHSLQPVIVDPLPGEELPGDLLSLPDRPTIYVTGGTIRTESTFFEAIVDGLRDLDITVVVTLGRLIPPASSGLCAPNLRLAGFVSQALLLRRCDAVVNHGGFSSVLGALACGVPLVILPDGADRSVNARRAAAAGAAVVLDDGDVSPATIRAAVLEVLGDGRYRRHARRIQAEIAALPGPDHAVRLIEGLVNQRKAQLDSPRTSPVGQCPPARPFPVSR